MREARSIMADLAGTGLTPDQMALMMELSASLAAEARPVVDEAAERRREKDREYQAERRAERRQSRQISADSSDAAPSFDKESPQTPKKLKPSPCVRPAREAVYHRLPDGWTPARPLPPKTQAKVDQWPPGALEDELAALHRWAANAKNEQGKGRKLDWDKAFVNWIERRHDEHYGRHLNGMAGHQPSDGLSATTRAAFRVFGGDEGGVPQRTDQMPRLGGPGGHG